VYSGVQQSPGTLYHTTDSPVITRLTVSVTGSF